jgi:hypothetical protein
MRAKDAYNAFINLLNAKPWFDKDVHLPANHALDMIMRYIQQQLQKEQQEKGGQNAEQSSE